MMARHCDVRCAVFRHYLLGWVVQMCSVLETVGSTQQCHEDDSLTHRAASPWSFHATHQPVCRLVQGAFPPVVPGQTLPASRPMPALPSCGGAELAIAPFGPVRPLRPWLVVNPGEGTASASGFMAATVRPKQFPRRRAPSSRGKFFGPPGPPRCCGRCAVQPARPSPGGSPTRTRWARSCNPERKLHHG